MGTTRFCWQSNAVCNIVAHFIRISWWGEERKCISSKKDPGENNGKSPIIEMKMKVSFAEVCFLFFDPQGWSHGRGIEKKKTDF